jgi:16S rRNA (adenine(1408)-N(1))-methyltransferase
MEILQGRRALSLDVPGFTHRLAGSARVLVDLGTGDGRFVQHMAASDPAILAVGIDACREQFRAVSRHAPVNAVFIIAAAETLPRELDGAATRLTVNFPWGSLLSGLLTGEAVVGGLARLVRPGAQLEVRLNAGALAEAGFGLEEGEERIRQRLRDAGFAVRRPTWWGPEELRVFPTTWAKRLAFGRDPRAVELRAARGEALHANVTLDPPVAWSTPA